MPKTVDIKNKIRIIMIRMKSEIDNSWGHQ